MAATIDDLKELMLSIGMDNVLVREIDPDRLLLHQGIDSLDCPAFAVALEERYRVQISDTDSLRLKTLNDFCRHVNTAV